MVRLNVIKKQIIVQDSEVFGQWMSSHVEIVALEERRYLCRWRLSEVIAYAFRRLLKYTFSFKSS
jgi:hypothetical protein